jgi:hypothetical protein
VKQKRHHCDSPGASSFFFSSSAQYATSLRGICMSKTCISKCLTLTLYHRPILAACLEMSCPQFLASPSKISFGMMGVCQQQKRQRCAFHRVGSSRLRSITVSLWSSCMHRSSDQVMSGRRLLSFTNCRLTFEPYHKAVGTWAND